MPINQARKLLRISHTSLTAIVRYWVHKAVEGDDLNDVRSICLDETAFRRGQSYVTVISDAMKRKVIDVEEGRDFAAVERFSHILVKKDGDCDGIKTYISDMSAAYESGKEMCFPYSQQIIDKFHVKQLMLKAMGEVRKSEQGMQFSRSKKSGKKLFMIPERRLTRYQQQRVAELSKQYPKTGREYRMVQALDEMYKCDKPEEGNRYSKG